MYKLELPKLNLYFGDASDAVIPRRQETVSKIAPINNGSLTDRLVRPGRRNVESIVS